MSCAPESASSRPAARHRRPRLWLGTAAVLISACSTPAPPPDPPPRVVQEAPPPPAAPAPPPRPPAPAVLSSLLAYADKLRGLAAAELAQEAEQLKARQGAEAWLALSLVHAQRQPPELPRAQELAAQALGDSSPEGQALQPLARLLAGRYAEQRRLEEQLDRQNRQLIEVQKRLDQSMERLEALKAIERSLGKRAPAASPGRGTAGPAGERHPVP